ncbi:MAG: hypothetical protein ACOX09_06680 [Candidatus Kapaibacterium sp.]|jgi:hypothetical protein
MDTKENKQILYIHEHNIKDVCKIGIGTIDRAKKAYQYLNNDKKSRDNKLAIFSFDSITPLTVERICKHVLKRINSTEFYAIEFYKACILFTLVGGKLDEVNSQFIDLSKISIKTTTRSIKNSTPLSQRFADLIEKLVEEYDNNIIYEIQKELNNNGKRNVLLTKEEFDIYNKEGKRTGWKSYKERWYYRTGLDATTLIKYIGIIEQRIYR